MKVILFKDVPDLGEVDSLANVSAGYARNYLFPKNLAGPATPSALAAHDKRKEEREKRELARRDEFEKLAQQLSALELTIAADAGEDGKLFGSVTAQDIASAAYEQGQLEVDKKKIELAEPIKTLGEHTVVVKLFRNINASLKVKVIQK